MKRDELAKWLIQQCEERNLSWAEASRRAGVSPNTISEIVNGTPVGLKRLLPLADLFGAPNEFVMRLAGILPATTPGAVDAVAEETRYRIGKIAEIVSRLPPDLQSETLDNMIAVLQLVHRAGQDQGEKEKIPSDKR